MQQDVHGLEVSTPSAVVNRVVAPDEIDAFVEDYASGIAKNAPKTIGLAKAGKIAMMKGGG